MPDRVAAAEAALDDATVLREVIAAEAALDDSVRALNRGDLEAALDYLDDALAALRDAGDVLRAYAHPFLLLDS